MENKLINNNLKNVSLNWWLRSVFSDNSSDVGGVNIGGKVGNLDVDNNDLGVAAACLII